MKELSIEEKARRYEEVIPQLKGLLDGIHEEKCDIMEEDIIEIFPELRECNDVVKCLINGMKFYYKDNEEATWGTEKFSMKVKDILSWLERQAEQKPAELPNGEDYGIDGLWHAQRILEKTLGEVDGYQSDDGILEHKCAISAVKNLYKQKPADKVEPKFKVGDVMRTLQEAADGVNGGLPVVISIDKEYYHCTNELIDIKDQDNYEYPPKNRNQKPVEWTEDDERNLDWLITVCERIHYKSDPQVAPESALMLRDWLKSIKDRVQH